MKVHNGMRPHDIVVLLKIISLKDEWLNKDLSKSLYISPSEISESLNRSAFARLISANKKKVFKNAFLGFIEHGVKFVFPVQLGTITSGIPTAHSAPILKPHFISDVNYVWPSPNGKVRGLAINPFYPNLVKAVLCDNALYNMLALVDAIRVGRVREIAKAIESLRQIFEEGHL